MKWVTTTLVLEQLLDAEDPVWAVFVNRFRTPIVRFARDLGLDAEAAEDVAQETLTDFVRAYREGQYDRTRGKLRSWLFGIAHRRVLAARRMLAAHKTPAVGMRTGFWGDVPDEQTLHTSWDQSWQQAVLEQCLEQIRTEVEPTTLLAFEMFAIQNRPAADVAAELNMTRNAVFIAKHRVLKRMLELQRQFEGIE